MLITTNSIQDISNQIKAHVKEHAALISVGEHSNIDINALIHQLNTDKVTFIGGIFPKVIHNDQLYDEAIVINTLVDVEALFLVKNISAKALQIPQVNFKKATNYSLITYVDGLTSEISNYLSTLYENYGMQTNYFGGGAGSLTLEQKPCVFSNEGFFMDAAVVCIMKMTSSIGVKHGWNKVDGPFIVTKAEGNVIKELNWENPFQIYKSVVEQHSGLQFNDDNFFDIAKGYPFGIVKDDAESIVRDPLKINDAGELICVGELENNMLVNILNGDKDSLISAAAVAAKQGLENANTPKKAIIIDCISRILFLEDDFDSELSTITNVIKQEFPEVSIGGALTLGEISSYGEGYLEFYNKTIVIGLFE